MGTRATYRFAPGIGENRRHEPITTIYIHWDGYPEGAAAYFYAMLVNPSKGNMATQFIRANEQAELTLSHDIHGDTEYRYDLTGHGPCAELKCSARTFSTDPGKEWVVKYVGPLHEFIAKNTRYIENYEPFVPVQFRYGAPQLMTLSLARKRLEAEYSQLNHLRVWQGNGVMGPGAANWDGCVADLKGYVDAFPELLTDEIAEFIQPAHS